MQVSLSCIECELRTLAKFSFGFVEHEDTGCLCEYPESSALALSVGWMCLLTSLTQIQDCLPGHKLVNYDSLKCCTLSRNDLCMV